MSQFPSHRRRKLSTLSTSTLSSRVHSPAPSRSCSPSLDKSATANASFTLTNSAAASLQSVHQPRHRSLSGVFRAPSIYASSIISRTSSRSDITNDATESGQSSPDSLRSPVPSFCRTASEFAPLPEAYLCDYPGRLSPEPILYHKRRPSAACQGLPEMNPILASLERKSRLLRDKTACSSCGRVGTDYPKCPRCGDMWCSRECRLVGGKKHVCKAV